MSMDAYFASLQNGITKAYDSANRARKKGLDPEDRTDIPLARNMAERVEGLISAAAPGILGKGIPQRIEQLEKKYGALAWPVALIIADEVASEKFCKFSSKKEAMEMGIRTGFAYHTVGVVAAPLEGFVELRFKKRVDGKEYIAASFAGPIRGAGGTAIGVALIIIDYIRRRNGYDSYDPTEQEINRFIAELDDYHERVTNLQYKPSPDEIKFLISKLPIEVDGDPSEDIEVSNYKDLPRISTNRIRSGVCLVVSMLALKAPKLWKELQVWGKDFGLDWSYLSGFIAIRKEKAMGKKVKGLAPDFTYISDLVAGRPVLSYPLAAGGFRLRYGRSRMSGYSAASLNPATMVILDSYIATGTQLKLERPGKAAAITPASSIDGPIVKLVNGDVVRLESETVAKRYVSEISEILFLGDILISYGDFFDRAKPLVPAGYCEEWYVQELEKAIVDLFGSLDIEKLAEYVDLPPEELSSIISNPLVVRPSASISIKLSEKMGIPIHPYFSYYWSLVTSQKLVELADWLSKATIKRDGIFRIIVPLSADKRTLELVGVPHSLVGNEFVVISGEDAEIVYRIFLMDNLSVSSFMELSEKGLSPVEILSSVSSIRIRDKAGTFIGSRMGRPEKAKMRALTGSPHVLFPVGEQGGRHRSFQSAIEEGFIFADFPLFMCDSCNKESVYRICECGQMTRKFFYCRECGNTEKQKCQHGDTVPFKKRRIDVSAVFSSAIGKIGTTSYPDLIKGVRGTSNKEHIVENLIKGILRAMNDVAVNKDGTTRYDMTELPITHFRPSEIMTPVSRLVELGYETDIAGAPLEKGHQLLELKPQDLILPAGFGDESADSVLFRVSKFVDDELALFYGEKPFYKLKSKSELVGHLVIGLAPHISAGMVGRIIGFSRTQTMLAHPLYHAAMRRDTDGDEACVMLLMDALLNFSRKYLPDARGAKTMDSPLVLTSKLVPAEVDDMVHRLDVAWRYSLDFYEATLAQKMPGEVHVELLGHRLGTDLQYEKIGFTHLLNDINCGVTYSAYKSLPSMEEKLRGQMTLAEKLRSVDATDVAKLVIEKHLIRDIKGNLRKFGTQQFRCVKCNLKYRRPPLSGVCECKGKLLFTVSEGAVVKYLEPAISLGDKYNVPSYLKQTLELTRNRVEEVFGREKEKQEGLGRWFG